MEAHRRDTAGTTVGASDRVGWFEQFAAETEPRLRRALVAALGQQLGVEATSIALAYGWEHCERIRKMVNPVGCLYRVGRTRAPRRRRDRTRHRLGALPATGHPEQRSSS